MAAQISPRFFTPPNVSHNDIVHQWSLENEARVVSIVKRDKDHICHVFNQVSNQFTERPVANCYEKYSWKNLTPEVVDTDQGPMCILKKKDERLVLNTSIKVGEAICKIWVLGSSPYLNRALLLNITKNRVAELDSCIFFDEVEPFNTYLTDQTRKSRSVARYSVHATTISMIGGAIAIPLALANPIVGIPVIKTFGAAWISSFLTCTGALTYESFHSASLASSAIVQPFIGTDGTPIDFDFKPVQLESEFDVGEEIRKESFFPVQKWSAEGKRVGIRIKDGEIGFIVADERNGRMLNGGTHQIDRSDIEERVIEVANRLYSNWTTRWGACAAKIIYWWNKNKIQHEQANLKKSLEEENLQREFENISIGCSYVQKNNIPLFCEIKRRWALGNDKELGLVMEKGTLRWWIFKIHQNRGILEETQSTFNVEYPTLEMRFLQKLASPLKEYSKRTQFVGSSECSQSTREFLYALGDKSPEEQLEDINSFFIRKAHILNCNGAKFVRAVMEPKSSFSSRMDERIKITEHSWAVTLIRVGSRKQQGKCNGKSLPAGLKYEKQHAEIVIEGIAHENRTMAYMVLEQVGREVREVRREINLIKGQPFSLICHFNVPATGKNNNSMCSPGDAVVLIEDYSNRDIDDEYRSQVWKRPRDEVLKMLAQVYKEAKKEVEISLLHTWGKYSIVNLLRQGKIDSCITWSFPKLEMMSIHLNPTVIGKIIGKECGFTTHTASSYFTYSKEYHDSHPPEDEGLL
ncbi:MAG: hypothetical protein PVI40_00515 [Chlamydiota bacterium]|jgi:hypothetical protein